MATNVGIRIRPVTTDDYTAFRLVALRQFHAEDIADSPADEAFRNKRYPTQRIVAAWDGDAIVGTYRSWDDTLAVPGATVTADLVSSVTVSPTHRRRGILRSMIEPDLLRAKESGTAVAYLIASSAQIYGRFGFGAAIEHATWTVDADATLFRPEAETDSLTVELGDDASLRTVGPAVYEAAFPAAPGAIARDGLWWDGALGLAGLTEDRKGPRYTVVVRDATGTAVGYARYKVTETSRQRVDTSNLAIHDLVASTPQAYAKIWQFLASIDLTATLTAGDRPVSEPLPWLLTDRRGARQSDRADFGWIRVLDVPAAVAARRYTHAGIVVIEVLDGLGLAHGTYAVEVDDSGTGQARPTDATPDLTLDVAVLGSVYLGQVPLQELAAAGLVVEHTAGAVGRADALFLAPTTSAVTLTWF